MNTRERLAELCYVFRVMDHAGVNPDVAATRWLQERVARVEVNLAYARADIILAHLSNDSQRASTGTVRF